jgi:hypothetical protein
MDFMDTAIALRVRIWSLANSIDALSMCRNNLFIHFDSSAYFSHGKRKYVQYMHKYTELMALEQA